MPAVRQVLTDGLDLGAGVTVLVGENGSGKSTLLESIATAYGLNPEGGSLQTRHSTRSTEGDLAEWLVLERGPRRPRWAYFLRAETMHGLYTYLEERPGRTPETRYHELSHGESFLAVLREKFADPGFFCMDEPEAALSFRSTIALIAELDRLRREGSQVVVATHSPLLAALPGATLVELGDHGARRVAYEDLELVASWRGFLDAPERYLRHLVHG
jgi:predicted ATPase